MTGNSAPRTIHDLGGFPRELYEVKYPAPGDPQLARHVQELLAPVSVGLDERWGVDHGTWSVLCHVFPEANVPVIQLSIDETQPSEFHYETAKRLRSLRDEGILVIGSGNLVHNLHAYAWGRQQVAPLDWAERLVKDALQYLDNLSKDAGNDAALLREIAEGYERVAAVPGGTAMSAHRGVIISASNLGDTSGALENFDKALSIRKKLVSSAPSNSELRMDLAFNYISIGFIHVLNGPPDKAVEYLRKGVPILESLYASDSTNEDLQYKLWNAELGLAKALGNPAVPNLGDWDGAIALTQKWGFLIERWAANHPDNISYQQALGAQYNAFGQMLGGAGKQREALESFKQAAAIDRSLVKTDPANSFYQTELAIHLGM